MQNFFYCYFRGILLSLFFFFLAFSSSLLWMYNQEALYCSICVAWDVPCLTKLAYHDYSRISIMISSLCIWTLFLYSNFVGYSACYHIFLHLFSCIEHWFFLLSDLWNLTRESWSNVQLLVFDDLEVPNHKTKNIVNYVTQMENTKKVLLVDGDSINEKLKLATQNLHYVNVLPSIVSCFFWSLLFISWKQIN